jgi:lipopolysaccharide export system protein LptA
MCGAGMWLLLAPLLAAQTGPADFPAELTHARRGRLQAKAGPVQLEADAGTLDPQTGHLDLRGHVRVTLPARSDRNLIRYGGRAVVTEQAFLVSADAVTVRNGLLRGRGHVTVRTDAAALQADEIFVYLRLGDGEVRGNIRVNGTRIELLDSAPRRRPPVMPPEVIR